MRPPALLSALTAATVLLTTLQPALATSDSEVSATVEADAAASSGVGEARSPELPEVTDRIVVQYKDSAEVDDTAKEEILTEAAAETGVPEAEETTEVRTTVEGAEILQLDGDVPVEDLESLTEEIAEDPAVAWAEPDRMATVAEIPQLSETQEDQLATTAAVAYDPEVPSLWALGNLRAFEAWDTATGKGSTIGIVDTGIAAHPDLDSKIIGGYDFVSGLNLSNDSNGRDADARDPGTYSYAGQCYTNSPASTSIWHGTHVAGSAAAKRDSYGTVGVAPDATILNARALGACGTGYVADMADAVRWLAGDTVGGAKAPTKRADVINMSLSMYGGCPPLLQNAINTAWSRGIPVAVAAGNNYGQQAINYAPGNCYNVITVGAIGSDYHAANYSNVGAAVDIYAPGHHILSSGNTGSKGPVSPNVRFDYGTSMASPHVAGTLALLKQKNPGLSADQYKAKILDSGDPQKNLNGAKSLNTHDALYITAAALVSPSTPTPAPTTPSASKYPTKGAINTYYQRNKAATGDPTSNEIKIGAGVYQNFAKGTVYWSSATNAQFIKGGMRTAYDRNGKATGALGFPKSGEKSNGIGGAYQLFEKGKIIWSSATGAYVVNGATETAYAAAGNEKGKLGYPTSDKKRLATGAYTQSFQKGRILWGPQTGASVLTGSINSTFNRVGNEGGLLGYPVGNEVADGAGGAYQNFQKGKIVWSSKTGSRPLAGSIRSTWDRQGGATGELGYPTGDEKTGLAAGGVSQSFQNGTIFWSSKTGSHPVANPFLKAYQDLGGPAYARMGYPTTGEYVRNGTTVQDFQGGRFAKAGTRITFHYSG